jgi:SAM-dependent methyltransferase
MATIEEKQMAEGMFGDNAYLYDLIYDSKDYEAESRKLRELLEAEGVTDGATVLEAACGTGAYLEQLRCSYNVSGFDLSPQMIELAGEKFDDVPLFVADMRDFDIDEPVDAIVCLFSSIGYVHGTRALLEVFENFGRALRPVGVVVVEPWIEPSALEEGHVWMQTYAGDDVKVCRQMLTAREGRLAVLDFHWLVARQDHGIAHVTDLHELYMYTHDEYVESLERAGFDVRYDDHGLTGRGLYIASRRSTE